MIPSPAAAPEPTPPAITAAPRSILLLCFANAIGGTEHVVLALARGLAQRGHRVRTCIPGGPGSAATLNWFHGEGVPATLTDAIELPWGRHRLRETLRLMGLFRSARAEVINIHYPVTAAHALHNLAARLSSGGARLVCSQHHPEPWNPRRPDRKLRMRLAVALADVLTIDTPQQEALIRQAAGNSPKLRVIPLGAADHAPTAAREELRARWGLPPDALVVGSLARLVLDKGFIELIDAVAALTAERPRLHLLIGGDGPDRPRIQGHAAARLGRRAVLTGRVRSPGDLYAASDLFALPSKSEGFGLVYIEAALRGIPSVALRIDGVPCAIEHDRTGLLADPADPHGFLAVLQALLDDPARRAAMGQAAQLRARSGFTLDRMVDRYQAVLCPADAGGIP